MTAPAVLRRWAGPAAGSMSGAARDRWARLRRAAPWGAVLLSGLVAHVALMPHLAMGGAAPDGLLVAVVAVSVGRGARAGAAFGFVAGLGADAFLATPLGTSALAYTLLGHALGRAGQPRPAGSAGALCTPDSPCFACRTGRSHPDEAAAAGPGADRIRRRVAARRAAFRRAVVLTAAGVGAGRLGVALVAAGFGGVPLPGVAGVVEMAVVAGLSAPFGPPVSAGVRRLAARSEAAP